MPVTIPVKFLPVWNTLNIFGFLQFPWKRQPSWPFQSQVHNFICWSTLWYSSINIGPYNSEKLCGQKVLKKNNKNKEKKKRTITIRHPNSVEGAITRFVIASNNGWHPRPPIARRATAILEIPKSKSASTPAGYHFCKISLSLEHFEILDNFAVSMVTAAILEIQTFKCNSAHASHYSCKVSSSLQHLIFFWKFWTFVLQPWLQ